jgi:recombination protein RecA
MAFKKKSISKDLIIHTGSTLLDLCISGLRYESGGVPSGKIVELFGPSAGGKTALACELSASCQANGGIVRYRDPEGRVDKKYAEIFGMNWSNIDYDMPNTVEEVFDGVKDVPDDGNVHLDIVDSAAALSTDLEMNKEDKMGMRRAKVFSTKFRKFCRIVAQQNRVVIFTNQIRHGESMFGSKEITPGGNALTFYSSLRIRVGEIGKLKRKVKVGGKDHERVTGIISSAYIKKSSIDSPYRECTIPIVFNYGIDDVRSNLEWLKENTETFGATKGIYDWNGKKYHLRQLIEALESEPFQLENMRKLVIDNWKEIESSVREERKPKVRI